MTRVAQRLPTRRASRALLSLAVAAVAAVAIVLLNAPARAFAGPYLGHRPPAGIVSPNNVFQPVKNSRGVVMLIHGGAFVLVGAATLLTSDANWWHQHRYSTYDIDYRAGLNSLTDVIAAYDWLRHRVDSRPICVDGDSAGGTLALLLAVERQSVACVITEGAIADLNTTPPAMRKALATWALPGHLTAWSPVTYPHLIHPPVLMGGSTADQVVPETRQLSEMKQARPQTHTMLLPGAPTPDPPLYGNFTHANVTAAALADFQHAELKLAANANSRAAH